MFKNFTMVDEFIRTSMRPKPVVSVHPDYLDDEDQQDQKLSHLGQSARINGDITLNENLCIDGEIQGTVTIRGKRLNISERARVKGEVRARAVKVRGTVEGDIHGEEIVHLFPSSTVTGNVHSKRIVVDDGAQFDGTLKTSRDAMQPKEVKKTSKPTIVKDAIDTDESTPKLTSVGA